MNHLKISTNLPVSAEEEGGRDVSKALWRKVLPGVYESRTLMTIAVSLFSTSSQAVAAEVNGRILDAPKLVVGDNKHLLPHNGCWNFTNKCFVQTVSIRNWIVVSFCNSGCKLEDISHQLVSYGKYKQFVINPASGFYEEEDQDKRGNPVGRVERMFQRIPPENYDFILCVLPKKRNAEIYGNIFILIFVIFSFLLALLTYVLYNQGPWKKKCLSDKGIPTQCISVSSIQNFRQCVDGLLVKINSKVGGKNSMLEIEKTLSVHLIKDAPTLILGMDVCHGSPGQSDFPSIAAVVGSQHWPEISSYRASVRAQSSRLEMIDALYKPFGNAEDCGIIREVLNGFCQTSGCYPKQIIVFRGGVSDSQFDQVLNFELKQIIEACKDFAGGADSVPKFTVIVAQKDHRTRLLPKEGSGNVSPGTVVETKSVLPKNYDFYMCAHAGVIGTSKPVHYTVLLDEIGFNPEELQNFIHSLSYVSERGTRASSLVAPIHYAHHAALQVWKINFNNSTTVGGTHVLELPMLHDNVKDKMFFC